MYRGLAEGENAALGLTARNPGLATLFPHARAGARDTQWISTTKSEALAAGKFGQYGHVRIDLNMVGSEVVDASNGILGNVVQLHAVSLGKECAGSLGSGKYSSGSDRVDHGTS